MRPTVFFIAFLCVLFLAATGWVLNIVAVSHMTFDTITGMLVLRVLGIFLVPLGVVMGFV